VDKLHLRKAVADDIPRMSELEGIANFGIAPRTTETWHKSISHTQEQVWVAEYDNILVGYHIITPVLDKLHLTEMSVDPEYRNRGIGRAMINNSISINPQSWAEIEVLNFASQNMVKSCGMYVHSYVKQYYANGSDAVLYVSEEW
jgi:ribosomal-protein-alanine N-acetyltransferase